jgi:hypothetical protein
MCLRHRSLGAVQGTIIAIRPLAHLKWQFHLCQSRVGPFAHTQPLVSTPLLPATQAAANYAAAKEGKVFLA